MLPLLYLYVETSVYRHTFLHICIHSSFSALSLVESIINPTVGCIFRRGFCLAFRCVENVVIEVTHLILCPPQMEVTGMLLGPDTGTVHIVPQLEQGILCYLDDSHNFYFSQCTVLLENPIKSFDTVN